MLRDVQNQTFFSLFSSKLDPVSKNQIPCPVYRCVEYILLGLGTPTSICSHNFKNRTRQEKF